MRINRVAEIPKYYEHNELKEIDVYKKNNTSSKDEQLSFSDILRREKEKRN